MAKVVLKKIIWQSEPPKGKDGKVIDEYDFTRVELQVDDIVPQNVPKAVQDEWEKEGWVKEDPEKVSPKVSPGPPNMLLPVQGVPTTARAPVTAPPHAPLPPTPTTKG